MFTVKVSSDIFEKHDGCHIFIKNEYNNFSKPLDTATLPELLARVVFLLLHGLSKEEDHASFGVSMGFIQNYPYSGC